MTDARENPDESVPADVDFAATIPPQNEMPEAMQASEIAKEKEVMLDVHAPHGGLHTWKDFWIHLGTITLGLLIAISLEQTVEMLHHAHQRHQLEEDLRVEAENNQNVIEHDLRMQELKSWFVQAQNSTSIPPTRQGIFRFQLAPPPCVAGSVGTSAIRYFAPSEAVWTAAQESGLLALLPPSQARFQARLAHNLAILARTRDKVYDDCQTILAMRQRFAVPSGGYDTWTMTAEQAEKFGYAAAETKVAIEGLDFRLRWSKLYEQGVARGETSGDVDMMTMDQTRFEDANSQ